MTLLLNNNGILLRLGVFCLSLFLVAGCTVADDDVIDKAEYHQMEISDFEINMEHNYIRGKLQNNGSHHITSTHFKLELFRNEPQSKASIPNRSRKILQNHAFKISEASPGDSLYDVNQTLSKIFIVREPLKPSYSTEFYFELKMDDPSQDYLYTLRVVQLKGR